MLNHTIEKRQLVKFGIVLSLIIMSANEIATADDHHHRSNLLYPPDAVVSGKKMKEWSAEWWQYIMSTPQNPNPLLDTTGGYCTLVQHGPVWFLGGTTAGPTGVTRTCTIPEGTALFFPLLNLADVNTAAQPVRELRAEIAGCMDAATGLSLVVDGQAIPFRQLRESRVRSVPFVAVFPPNGIPSIPPAPPGVYSPSVDDGFYVMLKPLSLGYHTLHFTGATPGCNYPPTSFHVDPFDQDITYNLTIVPVSLH
jgi:hypothetical protein